MIKSNQSVPKQHVEVNTNTDYLQRVLVVETDLADHKDLFRLVFV